MENIFDAINSINKIYQEKGWMDFEIISYQKGNLRIKGSTDFSYYHLLEIELLDVCYFHGVTKWGSSPNERDLVSKIADSEILKLADVYKFDLPRFAISFNSDQDFVIIVAANEIKVSFDVVYYYLRENLGINERIDEDVLKKGGDFS